MNKEVSFTWKNLLLTIIIVLLPIIITIGVSANYFQGATNAKLEQMTKDIDKKPSNAVLLQYMLLVDERFKATYLRHDEHTENYKASIKRLDEDIQRIEDRWLTDNYRGQKKK